MSLKDEGIVFSAKPIFEKDKQADIFFLNLGRQKVLLKNAYSFRASKSRILQPFTKVMGVLHASKSYLYLNESDCLETYEGLKTSYQGYQDAAFFMKVVIQSVLIGQKNEGLYRLLDETLTQMSLGTDRKVLENMFYLKFLKSEGIYNKYDSSALNRSKFIELLNSYTGVNIKT